MMKIIFVINDISARYMEYEHTGVLNTPNRRCVEIKLTQDQVRRIGIRKIGTSLGKDIMETIESVSITT